MPQARICKCDHVSSNHRITKTYCPESKLVKSTFHHDCLTDGCNCKQFEQVTTMDCNKVNYR